MSRRVARLAAWLAALVAGSMALPPSVAQPVPGGFSPAGTVRLSPGVTAHYAYHYDRNAMADALIAGDAVLALTDSGTLLRIDRATWKPTREWLGARGATCLGRGEDGAALAGFEDGRILRIDPASLAGIEVGRVEGRVQWVGSIAGAGRAAKPRLVAVAERKKEIEIEGTKYPLPYSTVHDLGAGKNWIIDPKTEYKAGLRASAILLDRKHRLWLGADNGEWGGWCSYVDLDAGQVRPVTGLKIYDADISPDPAWLGVYGFTELADGQVWAHGGTMHMGHTEGFIWRVDRGKPEELYRRDNVPPPEREEPCLPITHVVEERGAGSLLVLGFGTIYRTDAKLARWAKVLDLAIGYRWGRPDAVGAAPSVRAVLPVGDAGLLLATRMDGLIGVVGGRQTDRAMPGQLGLEAVARIERSAEGLLVLGYRPADPWRYRGGAWEAVSFAPPFAPADPNEPIVGPGGWHESQLLVGRGGSIVTVCASPITPGTRTVARWRDGKAEVLVRESSALNPPGCFLTPDGGIWNAGGGGTLRRLVDGRWAGVAEFTLPREFGPVGWDAIGWDLRAVHDDGPPWILHGPGNVLIRLSYGPGFKGPRLEVLFPTEPGQARPPEVRDAIPWSKGELLLATDRGLRTFAIDGGRLATPPLDIGGRSVARLARDGRKRLWLGGEGLAVLEADGRTLRPLDELPVPGRSPIVALAADPDHPDGVVAAPRGGGVVFVRVEGR